MSQRPLLIGVSPRILRQTPPELGAHGKTLQYLGQSVAHWIMALGAACVMLPTVERQGAIRRAEIHTRDFAGMLDGLVLQGGADIDPGLYDEPHRHIVGAVDCVRDRFELDLIHAFVAQDKPVLGICLGSQLLAHVLGAPVRRHRQAEIGWYRLDTTEAGRRDAVLAPLGDSSPVFQWHSYTFDIPDSAEHLAATSSCENQAFRYGRSAYGFQFHLEVDERLVSRWLNLPNYRHELVAAQLGHGPEDVEQHTLEQAARMRAVAEPVFGNFLDLIGRPQRRVALSSRL